ncbi:MAG: hypothetical protein OXC01_13105 [Immundisolibacterales bacterium]|nr:hypothetical protein [Immundisolibacterales bacterium]
MKKPVADATPDTAPVARTPPAGTREAAEAHAELLKKPDDDISELVSGATPPTDNEVETKSPSSSPVKTPVQEAAEPEPATHATPSRKDDTAVAMADPPENPAKNLDASPPTDRTPTSREKAAPARARTSEFRGTEETPAPQETITIRDLLEGTVEVGEHDVFYVHAVTPDDHQGLWGIIQKGVTENFARGVRITIGERTDTYRIAVPRHADEVLEDRSSSPLGLTIFHKSKETIVYNRRMGRLTQDPDVTLFPGNEIIIVGFKPEELINLYKHFAGTDGR